MSFRRTTARDLAAAPEQRGSITITEVGGVDGLRLPTGTIVRDIEVNGDLVTFDLYVTSEAMFGSHPGFDVAVTVLSTASVGIEDR